MKPILIALAGAAFMLTVSPVQAQTGRPQPLAAEVLADTADEAAAGWLRAHVVADGPVTGGMRFDFPADFYENRLFLLGESHGVAAPQVLDLELLRHLNARIGLRDYVAEVDPVQGDQLNAYLDTGDEALLDRVFDHWTAIGSQWGNTAFENKVRGVRTLNQTLDPDRRIRFIGIDSIQDWALLKTWIETRGGIVDEAAWTAGDAKAKAVLAVTALEGRANDTVGLRLSDLLGRISASPHRETAIFETYAFAVRTGELGERPAYGLWGIFHAMQGRVNGVSPFADRVNQSDLSSKDRVVTIAVLSLDSAVQVPVPTPQGLQRMRLTDFNIDGPFVKVQGSATLRAASQADRMMIFKPAGDGSPIRSGDFMTIRTSIGQDFDLDPAVPSSRYAQYIGVFRGSDWAPPRE
ncbi:MAG: hypothetical protein EON90_06205 [Brevundimonas sp.]|nr:MAG: hypothetical protein EON90_06205 [Brevundimonas sp.]